MSEVVTMLAWVALGSAAGGAARFFVSGVVARAVGERFPWGTMTVNVTGAFAIGAAAALAVTQPSARPEIWLVAVTGFLGSYTTVSSLSLQTLALAQDGEWRQAAANVGLSLALGLAAVGLGGLAAHALLAGRG